MLILYQHNSIGYICFYGDSSGLFHTLWTTSRGESPNGATQSKPRVRSPERATKPWVKQNNPNGAL